MEAPEPPDERALVDRARAGDRIAVGALYDLYVDRIYRFVLVKVGNTSDAEDITAEIFVRMIDAIGRFQWQAGVPFIAWLIRIAGNQVISHYRRTASRGPRTPIDDMEFVDPDAGPERLVVQKVTLEEVYESVKKLPEAQRQVIELRFGAGLSVRETAQALNKNENNVKVLQFKAMERLRKLLGEG